MGKRRGNKGVGGGGAMLTTVGSLAIRVKLKITLNWKAGLALRTKCWNASFRSITALGLYTFHIRRITGGDKYEIP